MSAGLRYGALFGVLFGVLWGVMSSYWLFRNFGLIDLSQFLTLAVLDAGVVGAASELVRSYLKFAVVVPLALTGLLGVMAWAERRKIRGLKLGAALLLVVLVISLILKLNLVVPENLPEGSQASALAQYAKPQPLPARKPALNVIWVFVESLEARYMEGGILDRLEQATAFMDPLVVEPLVNRYTVGGMVSAKCGVPILTSPAILLRLRTAVFNEAICFDDILRQQGYASYFLVGHDASLSGLRPFYERHGQATILDQRAFEAAGEARGSRFPTYPDEFVFKKALALLKDPALKTPFALNILTFDNHAPNGFPSERCQSQYGNALAGVLRCNSDALADFITALKREGHLDNSVLVVMGDHPFMGPALGLATDRRIFARIHTPLPGKTVRNSNPSPFDFFPSVLSAMGFAVGTAPLALGYSFYDVTHYPSADWKAQLGRLGSAALTDTYRDLH